MKEKYISDVNSLLDLPKRRKAEIIRDLDEIFRSASEHGESESEVISRLGAADEYAQSVAAEHEDERRAKRRFRVFAAVICGLLSAVLIAVAAAACFYTPEGIIGQSDSMTGIAVLSELPFDPVMLIFGLGVIFAVAAAAITGVSIRYQKENKGDRI